MLSGTEAVSNNNPWIDVELDKLLQDTNLQPTQYDRYAQREWRKFTIDITGMLKNPNNPEDQPTKLTINRSTFDLLLSFCFVGDIGYDPDDYQTSNQPSDNKNQTRAKSTDDFE
jgi:hypothetical protein